MTLLLHCIIFCRVRQFRNCKGKNHDDSDCFHAIHKSIPFTTRPNIFAGSRYTRIIAIVSIKCLHCVEVRCLQNVRVVVISSLKSLGTGSNKELLSFLVSDHQSFQLKLFIEE